MAFPAVTLRIAFATVPFAAVPTWSDVSSDLLNLSTAKGRQHQLDRIEAGTLMATLDNSSADYWGANAAGAYYPNVLVGKRINLRATYNAVTYDLFDGFIVAYLPSWRGSQDNAPVMTIRAVDLLRNLALMEINDGAGYAQELANVRVGNVLDDLGWPAGARDLNTAQSTMVASGAMANVKALAHLHTVQESELGLIFQAGDGDVQFQDRHARLKSPYLASSATFGDDPAELAYYGMELADDDEYIRNDVRMTRSGGTEQSASDATSQTDYGKRTLSRQSLLMTTDLEALSQAQWLLARYKDPAIRLKSLTIRPGRDEANLYPKALSYDISTRITVRLDQASLDSEFHIEGVTHTASPRSKLWETKWQLSDADSQAYWVLGTSQLGVDTRLAY